MHRPVEVVGRIPIKSPCSLFVFLYLAMICYSIMAFYFCKFLFAKKGLFLQSG
ncbi:hypothetical protein TREAZ_2412 [Leadbettera azotonutricia ZAS-9]|uniref:Uncharacterized protein n=1 Tax=Leadbettera azotonutricia (strain ATCC BAA-888 / DSM 13862 / ZAS-9) TaxID=545695 RepID=F5YFV2_LEAAZ|nr:hypothetical protein TREAZ_2412 [Leadbettera azotonutricia ZAS-9]